MQSPAIRVAEMRLDGAPMAHRSKREQGLTGEAMPLAERLSSAIGTD
jgi:hypothetical protein